MEYGIRTVSQRLQWIAFEHSGLRCRGNVVLLQDWTAELFHYPEARSLCTSHHIKIKSIWTDSLAVHIKLCWRIVVIRSKIEQSIHLVDIGSGLAEGGICGDPCLRYFLLYSHCYITYEINGTFRCKSQIFKAERRVTPFLGEYCRRAYLWYIGIISAESITAESRIDILDIVIFFKKPCSESVHTGRTAALIRLNIMICLPCHNACDPAVTPCKSFREPLCIRPVKGGVNAVLPDKSFLCHISFGICPHYLRMIVIHPQRRNICRDTQYNFKIKRCERLYYLIKPACIELTAAWFKSRPCKAAYTNHLNSAFCHYLSITMPEIAVPVFGIIVNSYFHNSLR